MTETDARVEAVAKALAIIDAEIERNHTLDRGDGDQRAYADGKNRALLDIRGRIAALPQPPALDAKAVREAISAFQMAVMIYMLEQTDDRDRKRVAARRALETAIGIAGEGEAE